jgi:hypothetical protein
LCSPRSAPGRGTLAATYKVVVRFIQNKMMNKVKYFMKSITIVQCCFVGTILLAFWIILSVGLEWMPLIPSFMSDISASKFNVVALNLSYSVVAAFIFYLLTIYFPKKRDGKILYPVMRRKINGVYQCFYYIYLEFGRIKGYGTAGNGSMIEEAIYNDDTGRELLMSADWNAIIPFHQKMGETRTYVQNMYYTYKNMIEIFDLIILYGSHLTAKQLKLIEDIRNSSFFSVITRSATDSRVTVSANGFIDQFFEVKNKMLELKKIQDNKKT